MSLYTPAELTALITKTKAAIEAALLGKEYRLDTGQSIIEVTRQNLKDIEKFLVFLEGQQEELNGNGLQYINPCY